MDSQDDIKQTPAGLHHVERRPLLDTWALVAEAPVSQQRADILCVHTGHMLLDVSSFFSRSRRLWHVHGAPHPPQREVVPYIITAIPKAGFTTRPEWSQSWITWNLRWMPRDQCQALWNHSPCPASWASARKLAANEKDASATSVVQSSFRSDQWKDLPEVMNKCVVESSQCLLCQPFEDYAELIHTVQVII